MAPPTTAPAMNAPQPSGSRSRNPSRRRPNDDAAYAGPPSVGAKRQAADKADGEPRMKRKRVDASLPPPTNIGSAMHGRRVEKGPNSDAHESPMDFASLPMEALHRYLAQYDLIPSVHPSPLTAHDPPPPASLLHPLRGASRALSPVSTITPANRPRRESREQSRRRSSRLLEEEPRGRAPVLADVEEVHAVLAGIAQRHFEAQVVKEVDSLASFMCAVKAKGSTHDGAGLAWNSRGVE
ncbi:hypothetical protein BV25DRAFT_1824684 [Artomyces pyxidatus]|uniref:Uncharacterized protein n=1 Tax=Artomyces pyxidatus TaxID=48021 RepID=A0ACB8T5G1_9AGAM|nr:hypothetical protein BV25DRAFT_1824684 [Artomyces pyxidatus]